MIARGWPLRGPRLNEGAAIYLSLVGLFFLAASVPVVTAWRAFTSTQHLAQQRVDGLARTALIGAGLQVQRSLETVRAFQALAQAQLVLPSGRLAAPADALDLHLRGMVQSRPSLVDLIVFDGAGSPLWSAGTSSTTQARGTVTACWDHLGSLDEIQIGRPRRAATQQLPVVCLREAVRGPTGDVLGFVAGIFDAERLSLRLRDALGDNAGVTTLLRNDGAIVARSDNPRLHVGAVVPERAMLDARGPQGLIRTSSAIDGRPLHLAWRQLDGTQMIVMAGIDPTSYVAQAEAERRHGIAMLAVGLLLMAAAFMAVASSLDRRRGLAELERAQESLERDEAEHTRLLSTFDPQPSAAYRGKIDEEGDLDDQEIGPEMLRLTGGADLPVMPGGAAARRAFFRRVLEFGEHVREYRLRMADGTGLWIRERCRIVGWVSPTEAEVVGVVTDIEEERRMRAQAEASARLTVLGQMAASIAHEISQPLAAISIAAEVTLAHLVVPGDTAKAKRYVENIVRQVDRMRDIAKHLRTFSRTDDGPLDEVPLEDVVRGALEVVGASLRQDGVVVHHPDLDGLPSVQGRLIPLEQVLVNLLVNARDAMMHLPTVQRVVSIDIEPSPDADWITIFVRDRGHGLPEGIDQHAFEPFFTTKPPGQGTGLGLSIAYGTILGFGGEITLGNRSGGGAEVVIRLRLLPAPEAAGSTSLEKLPSTVARDGAKMGHLC
ncbi:sensor histidine kinase [Roseococcus pinisoli]|uniref:histidine kinase n=1 Tax=Roseococcus pinisoli TaxID=2835040 RepID=A0ABS5QIE2_9PROT|nr:ATP-binding protein [Roseococcus pinisoli]MBS7813347.1 hypothetical protein [Roseococcus pinisoli]